MKPLKDPAGTPTNSQNHEELNEENRQVQHRKYPDDLLDLALFSDEPYNAKLDSCRKTTDRRIRVSGWPNSEQNENTKDFSRIHFRSNVAGD